MVRTLSAAVCAAVDRHFPEARFVTHPKVPGAVTVGHARFFQPEQYTEDVSPPFIDVQFVPSASDMPQDRSLDSSEQARLGLLGDLQRMFGNDSVAQMPRVTVGLGSGPGTGPGGGVIVCGEPKELHGRLMKSFKEYDDLRHLLPRGMSPGSP